MAIPLVVNGVTFQYPVQFDKNWGPTLTNWSSAVTTGMLQTSGINAFSLLKSATTNPAATGVLRLANADTIVFRNFANSADVALGVNSSNQLTFNGSPIGASTSLTNTHIFVGNASNQPADVAMTGDITITNLGVTAIGAGKVLDATVGSAAAIALSKLAASTGFSWYVSNTSGVLTPQTVTASRAVATDSNGLPVASAVTAVELGYLSGAGSALQTQINGLLPLSGGTLTGVLNMGGQRIAALATPTTAGDAARFPITTAQITAANITTSLIAPGNITTALFATNAVTQIATRNDGSSTFSTASFSLVSGISITTSGGKVFISASGNIEGTPSGGITSSQIVLSSGTTSLMGSNVLIENGNAGTGTQEAPFTTSALDSPVAGSYTYNLYFRNLLGSNTVKNWNFTVIEIKA